MCELEVVGYTTHGLYMGCDNIAEQRIHGKIDSKFYIRSCTIQKGHNTGMEVAGKHCGNAIAFPQTINQLFNTTWATRLYEHERSITLPHSPV